MKSIRSVIATLLVAALVSLGMTGSLAPNASAAGVCAEKAEYNKVRMGMTLREVKRIFGGAPTYGGPVAGDTEYGAAWKKCGTRELSPGQVAGACIHFTGRKVDHKGWTNLPKIYCDSASGGLRGRGPITG